MKALSLLVAASVVFGIGSGCSKDEAKARATDLAMESARRLAGIDPKEIESMRREFLMIKHLAELQDYEGLKNLCVSIDKKYNRRILGWYASILLKEQTEGVASARAEILRLGSQQDLKPNEKDALADIEAYFRQKGEVATVRLLLSYYALYLESEHSHSSTPVQLLLELTASKEEKAEIDNLFGWNNLPNPLHRTPAKAPSSSTEPEDRRP
jgi:hypothetical protein